MTLKESEGKKKGAKIPFLKTELILICAFCTL